MRSLAVQATLHLRDSTVRDLVGLPPDFCTSTTVVSDLLDRSLISLEHSCQGLDRSYRENVAD